MDDRLLTCDVEREHPAHSLIEPKGTIVGANWTRNFRMAANNSSLNTPSALQYELFVITDGKSEHRFRPYTNIMEMWDILPNFDPFGSGTRYYKELDINEAIRKYPIRHRLHREQFLSEEPSFVDLELHITPARIERRTRKDVVTEVNGKKIKRRVYLKDEHNNFIVEPVYVFAGLREDKVYDALMYLLSHGQGHFDSERTGVTFSIRQLFNELKRTNSAMSMDEIKEALEVLSKARCEIYGLDAEGKKRSVMGSSYLPNLLMVDRNNYQSKREEDSTNFTHCYAQFHIAVTMSIQSNQFRITHYEKHQSLRNLLSRFIHKILRTQFLNASGNGLPFKLFFNSLFADFGRANVRADRNLDQLKTALRELQRIGIIERSEIIEIKNLMDKRRIIDREIHLFPSREFIDEMITSNSRFKKNNELLSDFKNTKQLAHQINSLSAEHKRAHREISALGVSNSRALELLGLYDLGVVLKCLNETNMKIQKGQLDNPSGWFLKALQDGYYADAGFNPTLLTAPPGKHLEGLPPHIQSRIRHLWPTWDETMRKNFEKHGMTSPYIQANLENS